jgi:hypothetical protein
MGSPPFQIIIFFKRGGLQLQEQIVIKSDNSIIVTAPVMIPGAKDCDFLRGEIPFTVDQVRAFKEAYDDYGFIDKHHAIRDVNSASKYELIGKALKSFLLPESTSYQWLDGSVHTYPAGTWMLTSEITDPVAIKQARDGLITGYSPSVFPREQAEQIRASLKASSGGLIKDISDPVPALVSLVFKPCQHGNKFCKNGDIMSDDNKAQSKLNQIMNILGGKEPEYAMKEDLDSLKDDILSAFKSDEFKGVVKATVDECLAEALKQPGLKAEKPPEDEGEEKPPKETGEEGEEKPPEDEEEEDETKSNEKPAAKQDTAGGSKQLPLHDGQKPAMKSDKAVIFEIMGLDSNGRPKRN